VSVLEDIFARKRIDVAARQAALPRETVEAAVQAAPPARGFARALRAAKELGAAKAPALIAEVKKASPSKGLILADFDHREIARCYFQHGASCVSVLTDGPYFQGSLDYLRDIAALPGRTPLLEKDFVFCEYQILEARAAGADAILLIAASLGDSELRRLREAAESLGMDALVESHDEGEFRRAIDSGAKLLGVNNRDLRDFSMRLETSLELAALAPADSCLVAESGIAGPEDRARLGQAGFAAILVGETLMRAKDRAQAVMELSI
jgi:indole-3-glycerol phosphate synthase